MSARSHPHSSQPSISSVSVSAGRASRCTEALRDIAEDFAVVSDEFLHKTHSATTPTTELLRTVVELGRLVQEAVSALVVRHRSQGEPLSDLAPSLRLTEDRLRKKYKPATVDESLSSRTRPRRAPTGTHRHGDDVPAPKNLLRSPRQRLACALTLMQARSGVSQRELAERLEVHPSYVSRILSGERDASWKHVMTIAKCCEGNSDLLKPLWEAAAGVRPTGAEPARYLRTYLTALLYAAGSPTTETILASTQNTISEAELKQALGGPGVPAWLVVKQLTHALQGVPEITRPLWRSAFSSTESSLSAEAFG